MTDDRSPGGPAPGESSPVGASPESAGHRLSDRVSLYFGQGSARITLSGAWTIESPLESMQPLESALSEKATVRHLIVDGDGIGEWDSALIAFLLKVSRKARQRRLELQLSHFPEGAVRFLDLATENEDKPTVNSSPKSLDWLEKLGFAVTKGLRDLLRFIDFVGESLMSIRRFLLGRAVFRRQDLLTFLRDAGPSSLGIVTLISLLIGMILAFIGSVQLEKFGASIYIANLVGLSMAREMAAMMTAIIMSGRTGAAYAAQLGSMQVNEEIDALRTMGVSPMEFLVLPRMIALVLMMPLLTIYANLLGILGGGLVGVNMLDLSWSVYFQQISQSVPLRHFGVGLFKSVIFGILVALAGCFMGMHSGRSATAVGAATTSAVVLGIVLIIVFDSLVTILTTVLKI